MVDPRILTITMSLDNTDKPSHPPTLTLTLTLPLTLILTLTRTLTLTPVYINECGIQSTGLNPESRHPSLHPASLSACCTPSRPATAQMQLLYLLVRHCLMTPGKAKTPNTKPDPNPIANNHTPCHGRAAYKFVTQHCRDPLAHEHGSAFSRVNLSVSFSAWVTLFWQY